MRAQELTKLHKKNELLRVHNSNAAQNLKKAQDHLKNVTTKLIQTERENKKLGIRYLSNLVDQLVNWSVSWSVGWTVSSVSWSVGWSIVTTVLILYQIF